MADPKALQAIGLGFAAIMMAVVMRAVVVVADAPRTMTADVQGATQFGAAASTQTQTQ